MKIYSLVENFYRKQFTKKISINVNHEHRFVFIHIPKNAGTSVAKALGFDESFHNSIKEVKYLLSKKQFNSYFKFCFVRNPWDRFLSLYNYARLKESYYHSAINPEKALYGKHLDFDILESATLEECAYFLLEGKLKHDRAWNHWNTQLSWLKDDTGNIPLDFIGKLENIEEDFNTVCKHIGLQKKLPVVNRSTKRPTYYRTMYTKKAQQIISNYYKEDVEYFNYKF